METFSLITESLSPSIRENLLETIVLILVFLWFVDIAIGSGDGNKRTPLMDEAFAVLKGGTYVTLARWIMILVQIGSRDSSSV
jgi:hypothetical protein